MTGISRQRARKLAAEAAATSSPEQTTSPVTTRLVAHTKLFEVDGVVLDTLSQVFGQKMIGDTVRLREFISSRATILRHWRTAGQAYLEIGRRLREIDLLLKEPDLRASLRENSDKIFPFNDAVASMLRRVAEEVDQTAKLAENELPGSYTTAYLLARMGEDELEAARKRGLVRPDLGRPALLAFRTEYRILRNGTVSRDVAREVSGDLPSAGVIDLGALVRERDALLVRLAEIEALLPQHLQKIHDGRARRQSRSVTRQ